MPEKEFQKKIKFLLFVQAGLNQSDLSFERVIHAMIEADFIPVTDIPDGCKTGQMAIEFVTWQVNQARLPDWDYKDGQPDWYKDEWIDEDW